MNEVFFHAFTFDTSLHGVLNGRFENQALSPYLNDTFDLCLDFICGTFVGSGRSFCDDGGEGDQKVVLLSGL